MASTSAYPTEAFVLRPDTARRIAELLGAKVGPVSISALCADQVEREFVDVDALLAYDNVRTRELRTVKIDAVSEGYKKRAAVSFASRRDSLVSFSITAADDELVVSLRQDILAFVNESRPWYGRLATLDLFLAGMVVFGAAFVVFLVTAATGLLPITHDAPSDTSSRDTAKVMLGVIGLCGLMWLFGTFRERVFPVAVFAIGDGENRFRTAENIRWAVVIGFVISVAASLLVTFIRR